MATKKKYPNLTPQRKAALTREHNTIRAEGRKRGDSKETIGSRVSWATRRANAKALAA